MIVTREWDQDKRSIPGVDLQHTTQTHYTNTLQHHPYHQHQTYMQTHANEHSLLECREEMLAVPCCTCGFMCVCVCVNGLAVKGPLLLSNVLTAWSRMQAHTRLLLSMLLILLCRSNLRKLYIVLCCPLNCSMPVVCSGMTRQCPYRQYANTDNMPRFI